MRRLNLNADDLTRRYLAGEPINDLAESLGVSFNTVRRRIEESGIRIRTISEVQRLRFHTPEVDPYVVASEYASGESVKALSVKYGVCRPLIREIRDRSAANVTRMAKLSPVERLRLTDSAHAAVRGVSQSEKHRGKIAATRERRKTQASIYEDRLAGLLADRRLSPIPQKAVGRYNVDLALTESSVAVEVFGGHWHSSGRHATTYRKRTDYILDEGWSLVVVWCNALYPIGDGAADYIVSVHQACSSRETGRGQEHVIWGNGHGGPVREG